MLVLVLLVIMFSNVLYMVSVAVKWLVMLLGLLDVASCFRMVLVLTRDLMLVTAVWMVRVMELS